MLLPLYLESSLADFAHPEIIAPKSKELPASHLTLSPASLHHTFTPSHHTILPTNSKQSTVQSTSNKASNMAEEDQHYLDAYLSDILPKLGLDFDTYGPYVTGAEEEEEDGLDDIIDLLRASSESHSDDEESWADFKLQIEKIRKEYIAGEEERKNLAALETERLKKESLQREIEIAKTNALEVEQRLEAKKLETMSADKLALLDKFGYEVDDEENEEEEAGATTNRDHAAKQSAENTQKLRSKNQPSKAQLRKETMKAKADKDAKKEERRKRAAKGERKR